MYARKSIMKTSISRLFSFSILLLTVASCQEKKEDFFERDAREYTEKNCPRQMDEITRLDRIVFEKGGEMGTLKQYYTLTLTDDARQELMKKLDELGDMNLKIIRNSVILEKHKRAEVDFDYIYHDEATGDKIAEYHFTPEDYK